MPFAAADENIQVDVPPLEPIVLKFAAFDPSRVLIDEARIIRGVAEGLQAQGKWPLKSDYGSPIAELTGLRTSVDQTRIVLQYVHIERHERYGFEYGQTLTVPVRYQLERGDEFTSMRLTTPNKVELVTRKQFLFPPKRLAPSDELIGDLQSILNSATSIKVKLTSLVKGELSAPFKPEAILGNFERIMGRHTYGYSEQHIYDPKRDNVFAYRAGQNRIPVKVAAFPYRDGTKIVYEAQLPFEIRADGSTIGYDLPKQLKDDLEKVIND